MRRGRWRRATFVGIGLAALISAGAPASAQVYPPGGCSLAFSSSVAVQGETITAGTGGSDGFAAGATVTIAVQATGRVLATATADANGHISVPITIPLDLPPGSHLIGASGQGEAGATTTCTAVLSVAQVGGEGVDSPAPGSARSNTGSGGSLAFTGTNPLGWIALALVLLTLGTALTLGARRRAAVRARA